MGSEMCIRDSFTVLTLVSLGYWLISTALGFGDSGFEGDVELDADLEVGLDADVDADVELESGGDGVDASGGLGFGSFMSMIGLHLMPLSLVFTVTSLTGWLISIVLSVLLGTGAGVSLVFGLIIFVVALVGGFFVSGRVARIVAPIFRVQRAAGHRELIGRVCVLRTGRVDGEFGQAEVVDREGGSHLVQIRCREENQLTAGDQALLVDVEDGVFFVTDDIAVLRDDN